jgi:hypothetical protein
MNFEATDDQLKRIIFNAVEASKARLNSIGVSLSVEPLTIRPEHIKIDKNWLQFDYVYGRCVKLYIYHIGGNLYEIEHEPTPDRQTWVYKYPDNESLIKSGGGFVTNKEDVDIG